MAPIINHHDHQASSSFTFGKDLIKHNLVVFRSGEGALQVIATLNLEMYFKCFLSNSVFHEHYLWFSDPAAPCWRNTWGEAQPGTRKIYFVDEKPQYWTQHRSTVNILELCSFWQWKSTKSINNMYPGDLLSTPRWCQWSVQSDQGK